MSKPKLTSLLFLGFIGRVAETLTNLAQIAEGCRLLSLQPSKAPFAAVPTLRFFVSENSSGSGNA